MPSAVPTSSLLLVSRPRPEFLPTGFRLLDEALKGFPRGAITELTGSRSSGRTSLLLSTLAEATARSECCAVIDTRDAFDPSSAARSGVDLTKLVWVRSSGDIEAALKATDLLLHGGGFGVVCLDLCEAPPRLLNRIPISYWFRFRRAIENKPTVFFVLADQAMAKSCASCWIDFRQTQIVWSGKVPFRLLRGLESEVIFRKPPGSAVPFQAKSV
jgi:hypothetical protein